MIPNNVQTLVLNADYRPLATMPLSTCTWQEAVTSTLLERVNVVHEYNEHVVHSASFNMRVPSVISLKSYIKTHRTPRFTRLNVFARDRFKCQYCNTKFPPKELTFDHVLPLSRGGNTSWHNIVTACRRCNTKKGNRLTKEIGMYPINKPVVPSNTHLMRGISKEKYQKLHLTWIDYVYWDTDLE